MSLPPGKANPKGKETASSAYPRMNKECLNIRRSKNGSRKILTWNKLNGPPNSAKTNYKKMEEGNTTHTNGGTEQSRGYWNEEKNVCLPKRTGAASVLYKNHVYIFGGYKSERRLNDFYKYNIAENEWIKIESINGPSKRENNPAFLFKDKMYILGGYQGNEIWLNDFYVYDLRRENWQVVNVKKESMRYAPPSLFGFALSVDELKGILYLFGGYDGRSVHNKMYAFDLQEEKWIQVKQSGQIPSPRSCAIGHISDGYFYIFGGYNGEYGLNIFYQYHLETGIWTEMKYNMTRGEEEAEDGEGEEAEDGEGEGEETDRIHLPGESRVGRTNQTQVPPHDRAIPVARYFMGSFIHNKCIYILGGYNGLRCERLNDLYKFDLHKRIWFKIHTCNNFTNRSSMNTHFYKNVIYCIAGFDGKNSLSDVYALKLEEVHIEPSSLIEYYRIMVNNYRYADVIFVVQNKCPSFKTLFDMWTSTGTSSSEMTHGEGEPYCGEKNLAPMSDGTAKGEKIKNLRVIPIHDMDHDIFLIIVNYLYTDELSMFYSLDTYVLIVLAAYRYSIFRLMQLCERAISHHINESNVMDILILSYRICCKQLCTACIDFIINNKLLDEAKINRLTLEPYLLGEIYKKWIFN
ncbi:kelch domain-containing protein [Plasmodium cynomolgi strain B]|uniref:Kelch domain-containing protein n=1 Tax=Plasmodium cynomolgi (strain B) TaxID=1120755 RepID=K6ULT0_PLACD|nr:kelch domain-containing protein [Plasmodium cynomolgi strain B]GAB67983.1 kelch domain-containing protein [Plasmodium cynomolgi strain B]